jgi:hypothetical protein
MPTIHYTDYESPPDVHVHLLCEIGRSSQLAVVADPSLPGGVHRTAEGELYTFEHQKLVTCPYCYGALFGVVPCHGNVYVADQTLACDACEEELWNYPGIATLGLSVAQYEARFFARHPFMFEDTHDPGDEDPHTHGTHVPTGGFVAAFNQYQYGNAVERYVK